MFLSQLLYANPWHLQGGNHLPKWKPPVAFSDITEDWAVHQAHQLSLCHINHQLLHAHLLVPARQRLEVRAGKRPSAGSFANGGTPSHPPFLIFGFSTISSIIFWVASFLGHPQLLSPYIDIAGWWFGTSMWLFQKYEYPEILGISWSQLTNASIFFRGVAFSQQ